MMNTQKKKKKKRKLHQISLSSWVRGDVSASGAGEKQNENSDVVDDDVVKGGTSATEQLPPEDNISRRIDLTLPSTDLDTAILYSNIPTSTIGCPSTNTTTTDNNNNITDIITPTNRNNTTSHQRNNYLRQDIVQETKNNIIENEQPIERVCTRKWSGILKDRIERINHQSSEENMVRRNILHDVPPEIIYSSPCTSRIIYDNHDNCTLNKPYRRYCTHRSTTINLDVSFKVRVWRGTQFYIALESGISEIIMQHSKYSDNHRQLQSIFRTLKFHGLEPDWVFTDV